MAFICNTHLKCLKHLKIKSISRLKVPKHDRSAHRKDFVKELNDGISKFVDEKPRNLSFLILNKNP